MSAPPSGLPPIPSAEYAKWEPKFAAEFSGGIGGMVQPTGLIGYRIVAGVPKDQLNPYYNSPWPARGKNAGDFSIFIGETAEVASAECFGNAEFSGAPANTHVLRYDCSGQMLRFDLFKSAELRNAVLAATGEDKHRISRDLRFYLDQNGLSSGFSFMGWPSVSGSLAGTPGFAVAWTSGENTSFKLLDIKPIT